MSIFQLLAGGPWSLWITKLVLALELVLFSRNWTRDLIAIYQSGPAAQVGLAVACGLCVPICLNGIYEGFDRGNWLGLVMGLMGLWYLACGTLALFAPRYLPYLPYLPFGL